jgi:hypothetical protein
VGIELHPKQTGQQQLRTIHYEAAHLNHLHGSIVLKVIMSISYLKQHKFYRRQLRKVSTFRDGDIAASPDCQAFLK